MKKTLLTVSLILALAVTGCSKGADTVVLAKVNRGAITSADFKKQLEDLSPQMQQAVATDAKARQEFLEDLIGIELVIQEAKRLGLDKDAEFKKKQETLRKEMEQRIQDASKNELFNSLLKKELADKIKQPTDAEVKEYFAKHRSEIEKATKTKNMTMKQAEDRGLRSYIFQMKQRDAYLAYAKTLREKAKITVDDKSLETIAKALSAPAEGGLHLQMPTTKEETKK